MGCRNSPLTIKPYPIKIRGEYIVQFCLFIFIADEIGSIKGLPLLLPQVERERSKSMRLLNGVFLILKI